MEKKTAPFCKERFADLHLRDAIIDDKDTRPPQWGNHVAAMARGYIDHNLKDAVIRVARNLLTHNYKITDSHNDTAWCHIVTGLIEAGIQPHEFLSPDEIQIWTTCRNTGPRAHCSAEPRENIPSPTFG